MNFFSFYIYFCKIYVLKIINMIYDLKKNKCKEIK